MSESLLIPTFSFADELHPPTSRAFPENASEAADYVQPASSGRRESGMFGMTRNDGTRFHEGIDIRSFSRDASGKPSDAVFAVLSGKISHLCGEINGPYGRYVVLEHSDGKIIFYTLYAHLDSLNPELSEGRWAEKGAVLGVLGKSSSVYDFPAGTEHLHFEVGLRLSHDSFIRWYEGRFPSWDRNLHSFWNGLNLAGADPQKFFSSFADFPDFVSWMRTEIEPAFVVFVGIGEVPDILRLSPGLLSGGIPENPKGWRITFSWSGLPLEFVPEGEGMEEISPGTLRVEKVYEKHLQKSLARGMLFRSDGKIVPGRNLETSLDIIFGRSASPVSTVDD